MVEGQPLNNIQQNSSGRKERIVENNQTEDPSKFEKFQIFFRPAEIAAGPALAARVPYERQSGRENSEKSPGKAEHDFFHLRGFGLSHDKNRVETRKRRR